MRTRGDADPRVPRREVRLAEAVLDEVGGDTRAEDQGNRSDIKHAVYQKKRKAGVRRLARVARTRNRRGH